MTRRKFDDLVERIEAPTAAGRRPSNARPPSGSSLVSWASCRGSGYLLLVEKHSCLLAGLFSSRPRVSGCWAPGVLFIIFGVMQAGLFLLVDIGSPKGHRLKTTEAVSALWHELDSLRQQLQCRPISAVFVSMEFNAGVRKRFLVWASWAGRARISRSGSP